MKVLLVHNFYQNPGGEDVCFDGETRLLEEHGHEVVRFTMDNHDIDRIGALRTAGLALWNRHCYEQIRELVRRERPQVMHCTNTFPLVSPSAYFAAREQGVAVVQALHNYRLICPNALLLRDGRVCEDCVGKPLAWPGVLHACYRQSRPATAAVAAVLAYHRWRGTWHQAVDRYYALTPAARERFIRGGLPAEKLCVKPNFADVPRGPGAGDGGYCLFVGRLSSEKGIEVLLRAWQRPPAGLKLKVVGDGPLAAEVDRAATRHKAIEWLGQQPLARVLDLIARARCLVQPSICYETFGLTMVEAFAVGTPVVASRLGAMAEIVRDGQTGLLFEPNDPADLALQVERLATWPDPDALRQAARAEYLAHYTPERNYEQLMAIYEQAVAARRACGDVTVPGAEMPAELAVPVSCGSSIEEAEAIATSESRSSP